MKIAHQESIAIFCFAFLMDKFDRQVYDGPLQNVCRTHAHPHSFRGLFPAHKNAWIELSWKSLEEWRVNFCIGWGVQALVRS